MKRVLYMLLVLILSLSFISSADINLKKSSYFSGETLQAEIPDVFVNTLKLENIGIYQDDNVHETPIEEGLIKLDSNYFYYAVLPFSSGNFAVKINGLKHYEGAVESESEITKNFTITYTNQSYLSINPGALSVTADFSVNVRSYGAAQNVEVSFQEAGYKQILNILYNQQKTAYISIANISNLTKSEIKVGSYIIPIIVNPPYREQNTTNTTEESDLEDLLEIKPDEINITILKDISYDFVIKIKNYGDSTLKDVSLSSSSESVLISPEDFDLYAEEEINVSIKSDEDIDAYINLTYKNQSVSIPITVRITKNAENVTYNIEPESEKQYCRDLKGAICNYTAGETCKDGVSKSTLDGYCCLSECTKKSSSSASSGAVWGVIIIIILIGLGYWLYTKYKSGALKEKFGDVFRKRTEKYEEKIHPKTGEVTRSLTKN